MKTASPEHDRAIPRIEPKEPFWFNLLTPRSQIAHLLELDKEQNRLWNLSETISDEAEELKRPQFEKYGRVVDTSAIGVKYRESETVLKSSQSLRDAKVERMLPVAVRFASGNVNAYERFILSTGISMLRQNPSYVIQDNVLSVLDARSKDKHVDERALISSVVNQELQEYEKLHQEDPDRYPNSSLSALAYALEQSVYDIYGTTGSMDVLIRRLIGFYAPVITEYTYAVIPPTNTINRTHIRDLLSICASGKHPEWRGGRFLHKIVEHTEHPYTDEEFEKESLVRQKQALSLSRSIFNHFPSIIASGVTGSVARDGMQGFNPSKSDVDIIIYTSSLPRAELQKLSKFATEEASKLGVSWCPGTIIDDPLMFMPIESWQFNNPESISYFLDHSKTPDDTMFEQMAIMAANHYYGKIPNIRQPDGTYQERIHAPLNNFYRKSVLPLISDTKKLFADLDSP